VAKEKRVDTGWVDPPKPIRGLDHLGVQATCIALYTELLPGITNVTDRARYYSFYPWLLWSFDQRFKKDRSLTELRRVVRQADCLFALVAIRHARKLGDEDERRHGTAMVGRQTLLKFAEEAKVDLPSFATMAEVETRYFSNSLGGLGQYYYGALRDLRIVDQVEGAEAGYPGYGDKLGPWIAKAMDAGVDAERFFKVLEKKHVTQHDLDQLVEFCPCRLVSAATERDALRDLFLARTDDFRAEGELRRSTLALLLDLLEQSPGLSTGELQRAFRSACYTANILSDGKPPVRWTLPAHLERVRKRWGVYEQNDLFAVALQGLFSAVLESIKLTHEGHLATVAHGGAIASALVVSARPHLKGLSFTAIVDHTRKSIAQEGAWHDSTHEEQIADEIVDEKDPTQRAARSVDLLATLLARGVNAEPYADFSLAVDYFDLSEINLRSLAHRAAHEWASATFEEWTHWLATTWGV
jgi:hypothetical protein